MFALAAMMLCGGILAIAQGPANPVNPHTGIKWPPCANAPGMVYSYFTNGCVSATGTAANPAGSNGDFQFNSGGIFGAYTPTQALTAMQGLSLAATVEQLMHGDLRLPNLYADKVTSPIYFNLQSDAQLTLNNINGSVSLYPEWYGAVGNGSHDDAAAFTAMRAACPAANCTMVLGAKHYILTDIFDAGSLTTSNVVGYSLIGQGHGATWLTFNFSTSKDSCIRILNAPVFQMSGIRVTCNSHATYAVAHELTSSSAETQTLSNVRIEANGAAYGWAIGPNTNADIAHVNGFAVSVTGAGTADIVTGNSAQGNVLDNNCYGCTVDSSAGDGVLIRGGGFSMYGGGFDGNAGIDVNIATPPSQPVIISGVRSELSAQFLKNAAGGTFGIPGIELDNDDWVSNSTPNTCGPPGITVGPCAISMTTPIPITIIGGRYSALTGGNVQMNFTSSAGAKTASVNMIGVSVDNSNWAATLQALANNTTVNLFSSGDVYVDESFALHPGSGHTYGSVSPVNTSSQYSVDSNGNVHWAGNIQSDATISNKAGGFGPYSNSALFSSFDPSSIGSTWKDYCGLTSGTFTANTGDLTDPNGGNTALKYVQGTANPGCGGSGGIVYEHLTTLTPGSTYAMCGWVNSNGAALPFLSWGFDDTGGFAGSNTSYVIPTDTAWHYIGPFVYTIPLTGFPGTFSGVNLGISGAGLTFYMWHWQVVQGSSCGLYAQTAGTAISGLGFLDSNGVSFVNSIANIQVTTGTTAVSANSCTADLGPVTMSGLATTSTVLFTPTADVSGVTGWGSSGGLGIVPWIGANTLHYKICNPTSAGITPGGSVTWNVSAR